MCQRFGELRLWQGGHGIPAVDGCKVADWPACHRCCPPAEQISERTVGSVGSFMVAGQRIQLGRGYAQGVTVHLSEDVTRVFCRS